MLSPEPRVRVWAVEDKTTGAFAGQCGLRAVDEDYGPEIDLPYQCPRISRNKGYGTETVIAVLGHAWVHSALTASRPLPWPTTSAVAGHREVGDALRRTRHVLRDGGPE